MITLGGKCPWGTIVFFAIKVDSRWRGEREREREDASLVIPVTRGTRHGYLHTAKARLHSLWTRKVECMCMPIIAVSVGETGCTPVSDSASRYVQRAP